MSYTRDIVVLTKSAKNGGNCVAGIDIDTGEWVRPVRVPPHPISDIDMRCSNSHICQPLDVVRIPFISPCPDGCQTENEQIDPMVKWIHLDTWNLSDVLNVHPAEYHDTIFGNQRYSLYEYEKDDCDFSLMLIEVENLEFFTSEDNRKTKANFIYNNRTYRFMAVTDRAFYNNENSYSRAHLVVSLPNHVPDGCNYFKFIAKVFI